MATSALIPVGEYLATLYRPDCDYIDGEVQERNSGERDHGDLQSQLVELLRSPENKRYLQAITELRVQVKATRFRIPDVSVLRKDAPREQVVRTPPLLCIEVLSPEDTMSRIGERVRDYLEMGVTEVWVIDSSARVATVCRGNARTERSNGSLAIPETPVSLELSDIFKVLDGSD